MTKKDFRQMLGLIRHRMANGFKTYGVRFDDGTWGVFIPATKYGGETAIAFNPEFPHRSWVLYGTVKFSVETRKLARMKRRPIIEKFADRLYWTGPSPVRVIEFGVQPELVRS